MALTPGGSSLPGSALPSSSRTSGSRADRRCRRFPHWNRGRPRGSRGPIPPYVPRSTRVGCVAVSVAVRELSEAPPWQLTVTVPRDPSVASSTAIRKAGAVLAETAPSRQGRTSPSVGELGIDDQSSRWQRIAAGAVPILGPKTRLYPKSCATHTYGRGFFREEGLAGYERHERSSFDPPPSRP